MKKSLFRMLSLISVLALMLAALPVQSARAASTSVVISEFRVRGPNGGSDEFIELYNLSSSPVGIGGWKIKGSNSSGATSTRVTITSGVTLNPGCHYLVTNSSTSGGPYSGSVAGNQTYSTGITDDGGIAITTAADAVIDAVGMSAGSAFKEGTPLASLGSSNLNRGYERKPGGTSGSSQDTDNNSNDFQLITPSDPQNLSSACIVIGNPTGVGTATPDTIETGNTTLLTVAVTPGTNPTSTGLAVTADLSPIGGSAAQAFYDDGTNGDVAAGDNTFSFLATSSAPTACGASLSATITDAQGRQGSASIALTVKQAAAIHDIQGASHISPLSGKCLIDISGIVTAKRTNGFYLEAPKVAWDADDRTSEGIFVFTSSAPAVSVGDDVVVTGTPQEFRPGGASSTNLTTTEISTPGRSVTVSSHGNQLPPAVVIGTDGRIPPATVIEDDASGDVETSGVFDPASDGIDFYESLEGMLVQVNDAVAVGPWHDFGTNREIPVVGDNGANAGERTNRGGVVIQANDFNPERIILNDLIVDGPTLPSVNVDDSFPGATLGVMDYSFGNFKLEVTSLPSVSSGNLAQEVTSAPDSDHLAAATFNVENLAPTDPQSKFDRLAGLIVNNLQAPDVIAIEEIQDNNGVTNDGTVDASTTWGLLISAIQTAGGPTYDYRQIDPVNDEDGGAPGGNIRQGFLFRTDRGLSFIDRPGGGSTISNAVVGTGAGTQLEYSPGRIDPNNSAFTDSRKPLAGEFMFNGRHLFVIANHFNSKSGDQPLFGHLQPPTFSSEVQRLQQAQVEHDFMQSIVNADPNADVIVLGDLNDFQFSSPLQTLTGANVSNVILNDLIDSLPLAERYSYVFDGNSEVLDHTLLSNNLFATPFEYDVVHVNSEFADQASDHEPQVVRLLSYLFSGFFPPVDNPPELNVAKAGSGIPVKFSLNGDKGLDIFAAGYPQSTKIACDSSEPQDTIEETVSPGSSGLSYDPTTDTYTYVWKTDKKWAGTCRQLVVKLVDGTFHVADFNFTK